MLPVALEGLAVFGPQIASETCCTPLRASRAIEIAELGGIPRAKGRGHKVLRAILAQSVQAALRQDVHNERIHQSDSKMNSELSNLKLFIDPVVSRCPSSPGH